MFYIWAQNSGWDALARPGTAGFTSLQLSLKITGTRKTAWTYLQCIQISILNYSSCPPSGLPCLSVFQKATLIKCLLSLEKLQACTAVSKTYWETTSNRFWYFCWKFWWMQCSFFFSIFICRNNSSEIRVQRCLLWSIWSVSLLLWKCFYHLNLLAAQLLWKTRIFCLQKSKISHIVRTDATICHLL